VTKIESFLYLFTALFTMDYKVEYLKTNFGKGGRIEKGKRSYEQFSCRKGLFSGRNGLFARVYQAPYTDYYGVIFRTLFQDNDSDYEQFKVLAERLQQLSGEEISSSKARFMDYISHSGLEKHLSRIGADVRINLKDKEPFPDAAEPWLNSMGRRGGTVSDLAAYSLGLGIIGNDLETLNDKFNLAMYSIVAPILEGAIGGFLGVERGLWMGPVHAIGYALTKKYFKEKLRDPDYMLEKFMENYQKLDSMGSKIGSQKKYATQSKKADRHFEILEGMFPFTKHQRGFSITYDNPDRDNVISFLGYVLEGGNPPQLPAYQSVNGNQKENEEIIEVGVPQEETQFIDPWKVKIPKLGGKKND